MFLLGLLLEQDPRRWLITRARSKKVKEALDGLIQEIWTDFNTGHSKLGPKEDEDIINLIQTIEG